MTYDNYAQKRQYADNQTGQSLDDGDLSHIIADHALSYLIVLARDKRVLYFSQSANRLQETLDKPTLTLQQTLSTFVLQERSFDDFFARALDGEECWAESKVNLDQYMDHFIEIRFSPIVRDGKISGVFINATNISKRKQVEKRLKKSKANLKAMFDSSPSLYILLDRELKILTFNRKAAAYFKNTLGHMLSLGSKIVNFLPTNLQLSFMDYCVTGLAGKQINIERSFTNKDGGHIAFELNFIPVLDSEDQVFGVAFSALDITQRKDTEKALRLSEQRLRQLNATKDKFFSIIGHDLKNPFNNLMGVSELLLQNIDDFDREQQLELISYIYESSSAAYELLENLLKWSMSQTERLQCSPRLFFLHDVLEDTKALLNSGASKKGIDFEMEIPDDLEVYADKNMITTVIRNLVSNAIKFTRTGGKILVNGKQEADKAVISVKDEGIGMNEETLNNLFDFSYTVSQPGTSNEHGTGLGLVICKEFVEKNEGSITARSQPDKGSTFIFSLPMTKPLAQG